MESENEQLQTELQSKAILLVEAILDYENPERLSPELINYFREDLSAALDTDHKNYNKSNSVAKYFCHKLNEKPGTKELKESLEKFFKKLATPQIKILHSDFIIFVEEERKEWIKETFKKVLRGRALSEDFSSRINYLSEN